MATQPTPQPEPEPHPDDDATGFKCLTCGAEGTKRWTTLRGMPVCDECWLDVAMDEQAQHWRQASAALPKSHDSPSVPKSSGSPRIRHKPGSDLPLSTSTSSRLRGGLDDLGKKGASAEPPRDPDNWRCRVKWRETAAEILQSGVNSLCLICGHVFYGAKMPTCSRCGGLCAHRSDHDLGLMGRRPAFKLEKQ